MSDPTIKPSSQTPAPAEARQLPAVKIVLDDNGFATWSVPDAILWNKHDIELGPGTYLLTFEIDPATGLVFVDPGLSFQAESGPDVTFDLKEDNDRLRKYEVTLTTLPGVVKSFTFVRKEAGIPILALDPKIKNRGSVPS